MVDQNIRLESAHWENDYAKYLGITNNEKFHPMLLRAQIGFLRRNVLRMLHTNIAH